MVSFVSLSRCIIRLRQSTKQSMDVSFLMPGRESLRKGQLIPMFNQVNAICQLGLQFAGHCWRFAVSRLEEKVGYINERYSRVY